MSTFMALLAPWIASAQQSTLFSNEEPLVVRLEAPLRTVLADRSDPEYRPARITVDNGTGEPVGVDARVRVRGKSRTIACDFPPLLLNFPNDQPEGSPFSGENRLKLVTHCESDPDHEVFLQLERQIYRALNLLTDSSLRTRAVKITYVDSDRGREIVDRVGFLIEDEERFAERSGLNTVALESIPRDAYDPSALIMVEVFQYFIGNTDWSAFAGPAGETCCHNIVPFARSDGVLLPVPYDFDATGIVGVPYAAPDERLPIQSVRERLYRGRCRELAALAPAFATFTAKREALTALFTDASLPERRAQRAREFIDEFYEILADDRNADREFRNNCGR